MVYGVPLIRSSTNDITVYFWYKMHRRTERPFPLHRNYTN